MTSAPGIPRGGHGKVPSIDPVDWPDAVMLWRLPWRDTSSARERSTRLGRDSARRAKYRI